jgi:L,D-transpeptidase ErfK/SrfK
MKYTLTIFIILFFLAPPSASAAVYPGAKELIGAVTHQVTGADDSLMELARRCDLGYAEIAAANPELDPFLPGAGRSVVIPTAWIVPQAAITGEITVNLSELRLYYPFTSGMSRLLVTFPIGIGGEGTETPLGSCTVIEKIVNPPWHVPLSVKKEKPELPDVVPPGPDNPLGTHALRLSKGSILIHGTNKPWGVGRKVSHGCLRLYPEDIPRLFEIVPVGARVNIVREPVKVGVKWGEVYVEVHRDDNAVIDYLEEATRLLVGKGVFGRVDPRKLHQVLREKSGLPVVVSKQPAD